MTSWPRLIDRHARGGPSFAPLRRVGYRAARDRSPSPRQNLVISTEAVAHFATAQRRDLHLWCGRESSVNTRVSLLLVIFSTQATALLLPGYIRLGPLRLTVFGLFAAAGLIAALLLSQRTAPRVALPANKLWDAGVIAIIAAFVTSRILLIAFDARAFLKYPLLVLSLPSLTYAGMVLTALLVCLWLRRQHLPLRDVLDAWAPCAALLAAVLSLAHFVEGTDAGMPTHLPWGIITPGDTVLGRVHPVQIYAAVIAFALCIILFRMLPRRKFSGQIAALALITGGLAAFLLDMLQQPVESSGDALLDPGQFVALAAIIAGTSLHLTPPQRREFLCGGVLDREPQERESA
jgi:phosphatidylglycerol---prolipoprotein diacylglyceryl transferase